MRNVILRAACFAVALVALTLLGCGQQPTAQKDEASTKKGTREKTAKKLDDHGEWWCAEHGIPEEECSLCSSKVAKEMKAKGDWCNEHDRGKSQCFICDPSLKEKFAAKYRARYGKEPPPVDDEMGDKK